MNLVNMKHSISIFVEGCDLTKILHIDIGSRCYLLETYFCLMKLEGQLDSLGGFVGEAPWCVW